MQLQATHTGLHKAGALLGALTAACALGLGAMPAMADEADPTPAHAIEITAESVGANSYRLNVKNTGTADLATVSGSTMIPEELVSCGLEANYAWQAGALKAGAAVLAQHDGSDVTLTLNNACASNGTEQPGDQPSGDPSTTPTPSTPNTSATTGVPTSGNGGANGADRSASADLSSTGSPVAVIAAIAFLSLGGAAIAFSFTADRGAVRKRTLGMVAGGVSLTLALACVMPNLGTRSAQAAETKDTATGVTTNLRVGGKDYTLTSEVTVTYAHTVPNTLDSVSYAKAMGAGWNLGNQFDGENTNLDEPDLGEEAWGNPKATRELIHSVKEQGYSNIRIPMTVDRRSTKGADGHWTIDEGWLKRYREVVDWATAEGLYAMINIHHDSWIWLKTWNGDKNAEEYTRFVDYWKQLAPYFADADGTVCFETINEPQFDEGTDGEKQAKLDALNQAAYEIIRASAGNETRMVVMPTMNTGSEDFKLEATQRFITGLNDPYVMATVHYYSEWVFSANLGKTRFDEQLFDDPAYTPRTAIDQFMNKLSANFADHNIGVCIGEFGLLAYDSSSDDALQSGEELKYYEYVAAQSNERGFSYDFWDNGSGINRWDESYPWKKPAVGEVLAQAAIKGRSSYTKELNMLFYDSAPAQPATLHLELNGNTFAGIDGLTAGVDYTYDESTAALTLTQDYLARVYSAKGGDGVCADLALRFSAGPVWHQFIVRVSDPALANGEVNGTRAGGIAIPVEFNGNEIMNITAMQNGQRVGPNSSWWNWLQNGEAFQISYDTADRLRGTITMRPSFFGGDGVTDGEITLTVTFQNGSTLAVPFTVHGETVTYSHR